MFSAPVVLLRQLVHALLSPITWPVQRLRQLTAEHPNTLLFLLAAMILLGIQTVRGGRWSALALVPAALAWLVFNGSYEGPTLVRLSWSHGITASDLVAVVALLLAAWRLLPVVVKPLMH